MGLHDRALLQRAFEIGFHPIILALSTSAPQLQYIRLLIVADIYYLERFKFSPKVGNLPPSLLYEDRDCREEVLHSLKRRPLRADQIKRIAFNHGAIGCGSGQKFDINL